MKNDAPGGANGRRKIISTFVAVGCLLAVSVVLAYIIGLRASQSNRDLLARAR